MKRPRLERLEPVPTLSTLSLSLLVFLLTIVAALRYRTAAPNRSFNRTLSGGVLRRRRPTRFHQT